MTQSEYLRKDGIGANSRDRTDDLRITNALLYQLSYVGLMKSGLKDIENWCGVNSALFLRHQPDQHQLQNGLIRHVARDQGFVRFRENPLVTTQRRG